jgi:hypothetical protein
MVADLYMPLPNAPEVCGRIQEQPANEPHRFSASSFNVRQLSTIGVV